MEREPNGAWKAVIATVAPLMIAFMFIAGCGREKAAVPETAGLGVAEAEAALHEAGLKLGALVEGFSDTVPRGKVVSSEPGCGDHVELGSEIELTVSRGPEKVTVSSVLGMTEADAVRVLRELGFRVEIERAYSEDTAPGRACGMDPIPGTVAANGSAITLTISEGSAYVSCSNCNGRGKLTSSSTCARCGGTGTVAYEETCPECGGGGLCPT